MVEQGQGRLVLVSSVSGLVGAGGLSIYSAAKGGVIAFAKSLAREFASKGISVNCVAPGGVATRAFPAGSASSGKRLERIAIGRLADPDEVANVIAYLAIEAPNPIVEYPGRSARARRMISSPFSAKMRVSPVGNC